MSIQSVARVAPRKSQPLDYPELLTRFGDKDRASVERQSAAYAEKAGPAAVERWQRLARVLMGLAGHMPKVSAKLTIQFYIPDGKYKMQVFGLQAEDDGTIAVYCPDVIKQATAAKILGKPRKIETQKLYPVGGSEEDLLPIDELDGDTPNPDLVYKHMTGWNRRAIRMTLSPRASKAMVKAVEQVCEIAARQWP